MSKVYTANRYTPPGLEAVAEKLKHINMLRLDVPVDEYEKHGFSPAAIIDMLPDGHIADLTLTLTVFYVYRATVTVDVIYVTSVASDYPDLSGFTAPFRKDPYNLYFPDLRHVGIEFVIERNLMD